MFRKTLVTLSAFVLLFVAGFFIWQSRRKPTLTQPAKDVAPIPSSSTSAAPERRSWPTPFSVEVKALPPADALPPGTLRILVLGDSVASFLGLAMRYRQDEAQAFVGVRGVGSCSIFEAKPYFANGKKEMGSSCSTNWASDVAELRPDVTLIVMGGAFFNEGACTKPFRDAYEKRIFELTKAMGPHAGRIVITRVPYPVRDWRHGNVLARVDCLNAMLVDVARKGNFDVVDLMSYVCPTPACNMESQGKPIRPDGLHFDGAGTEDTARWVLQQLRKPSRN